MKDDGLTAMDEWCKARAARISESVCDHLKRGGSLDDPNYRAWLGEHRAYLAMRSFIHGSLDATPSDGPGERR